MTSSMMAFWLLRIGIIALLVIIIYQTLKSTMMSLSAQIYKTTIKLFVSNKFLFPRTNNLRPYGVAASISNGGENLVLKRDSLSVENYPSVWLRDNCTCTDCFHKAAQARIINWLGFNVDTKIKSLQNHEDKIIINWDDDHKSVYTLDWLETRSFSKEKQKDYLNNVYIPQKKLWGKQNFLEIMKIHEYHKIMNNDENFYNWLMDLAVYGVVLVKNAPPNPKECKNLLNKIAFIRKTHYGEDFHVVAKDGTNNVAYLSNPLQLHTDLPYYDYKPGVNLLHCIIQTKNRGGENLLTDTFYVAEKLRKEQIHVFQVLAQTDVNWSDIGTEDGFEFNKIHRAPVISLDKLGNVVGVRHSIPQRDSHFTVDVSDVKTWYKALRVFVDELHKNAAEFKTQPGDVLAFDNTRLVHGRAGYEDTEGVKRLLVGHYIDWDEIYSRIRVLRNKLQG